jgi:hypothetical protein
VGPALRPAFDGPIPLSFEAYLLSDLSGCRFPFHLNWVEDELEYELNLYNQLDAWRYDGFPFDAETCQKDNRYLGLGPTEFYPISADGIVDFSGYASQLEVTGNLQVPLDEVMGWFEG